MICDLAIMASLNIIISTGGRNFQLHLEGLSVNIWLINLDTDKVRLHIYVLGYVGKHIYYR